MCVKGEEERTWPSCFTCTTNRQWLSCVQSPRRSGGRLHVLYRWCGLGGNMTSILRFNICLYIFPPGQRRSRWRRRNHCNRGKHEGVTLLPLTSPEKASLSCEESRLNPSFSPPNPTQHVSHLDRRLLGQKGRERGSAQPQRREPSGDGGLNWGGKN